MFAISIESRNVSTIDGRINQNNNISRKNFYFLVRNFVYNFIEQLSGS